jgi:TRAP-type C4-dicarboxylate transport system permease small subunit
MQPVELLKQINDWTERLIKSFLIMLITGILVLCFYQVITRFVFIALALAWTEEVARLLYVWGCFFGAAVLIRQKRIIRVDVVSQGLPSALARILELIILLSMLAFSLILVVKGFEFTQSIAQDRLTLLGYPRNWFWLPIPMSSVFSSMYILEQVIDYLGNWLAPVHNGIETCNRTKER